MQATEHAGHAEQIAATVSADEVDVIAVAGGDGTINETINGFGPRAPVLAVIPCGTANVVALELGLPSTPSRIAGLIAEGQPAAIHPGRANGRRFVMMAGVGYDAHVVAAVTPDLKRRLGKAAYVWRSLTVLRQFDFAPYRITIDGRTTTAASAIVANGRYYAGRHVCAPSARLDQPGFQVCLFARGGAWNALRYGTAMLTDRLPTLPDFAIHQASRVEIAGRTGEPVQGDGDVMARLPVSISVDQQHFRVLRPPPGRP